MYKNASPLADKLYIELINTYGEWIEMGHPLEEILLSLLVKEREKNDWLTLKLARIKHD